MLDASTIAYVFTAALCFLLTWPPGPRLAPRHLATQVRAWKVICVLLVPLGIVRPYEVHSKASEVLRTSAMTGGWYGERMSLQLDMLLAGAVVAAVVGGFLLFETRRWHASSRVGVMAIFYLAGILLASIVSLHGLDAILGRRLAGIPLRWMVDSLGLVALIAAAWRFRRYAGAEPQFPGRG